MRRHLCRSTALVAGSVLAAGLIPGQEVHLKTRDLGTGLRSRVADARKPSRGGISLPRRSGSIHQIVQFDHPPGVEDLDELLIAGATIIASVPDNAVMVSLPYPADLRTAGIALIGKLDANDKLSPDLGAVTGDTRNIDVILEFHADVSEDGQQSVLSSEGVALLHTAALLSNHSLVSAPPDKLRALAEHDEIAYIFPADAALIQTNALMSCAGMLTMTGPIAQYVNIAHGWDPDADHSVHLGYSFGTMTSKVPASIVQAEIIRALQEWSRVTSVIFHPAASGSAARTIQVNFASGAHGDAYPFDGAGGTLAHTFYPVPVNPESIAGDMHLNADENWHAGGDVDIFTVALHEAGHAIGLAHSDKPGDVMYPYYRRGMQLSANDIASARTLYGSPNALTAPAQITSTPVAAPAALSISLNPVPAGIAAQIAISGTVDGGSGPLTVQWQTDRGYSGKAVAGTSGTWTATGVTLAPGINNLTVTALDSGHHAASQTAQVIRPIAPAGGAATPVSVSIRSPASAVVTSTSASMSLAGIASSASGIVRIAWQSSSGASGIATGTDHWLASNISLLSGTNTILVRAYDANGTSAWASLVVVRH